jgi:hypothetical protein
MECVMKKKIPEIIKLISKKKKEKKKEKKGLYI